ncbi:hypothetical protein [Nostoc phage N1]|nr:hypothetical protein [Nostoc phage N1]
MEVLFIGTRKEYIINDGYENISRLGGILERLDLKLYQQNMNTLIVDSDKNLKPFLTAYCQLLNIELEYQEI